MLVGVRIFSVVKSLPNCFIAVDYVSLQSNNRLSIVDLMFHLLVAVGRLPNRE